LLDGKRVIQSSELTLSFSGDRAVGSGGCNSYGAGYQTKDRNVIGFSSLSSTLIQCSPKQVNEEEQAYLSGLQNAANFYIEGDRLEFLDAVTWEVSMVFARMR
jgi:heat shock protein HslJ